MEIAYANPAGPVEIAAKKLAPTIVLVMEAVITKLKYVLATLAIQGKIVASKRVLITVTTMESA